MQSSQIQWPEFLEARRLHKVVVRNMQCEDVLLVNYCLRGERIFSWCRRNRPPYSHYLLIHDLYLTLDYFEDEEMVKCCTSVATKDFDLQFSSRSISQSILQSNINMWMTAFTRAAERFTPETITLPFQFSGINGPHRQKFSLDLVQWLSDLSSVNHCTVYCTQQLQLVARHGSIMNSEFNRLSNAFRLESLTTLSRQILTILSQPMDYNCHSFTILMLADGSANVPAAMDIVSRDVKRLRQLVCPQGFEVVASVCSAHRYNMFLEKVLTKALGPVDFYFMEKIKRETFSTFFPTLPNRNYFAQWLEISIRIEAQSSVKSA